MPPLNNTALALMRQQEGLISRPQAIRCGNPAGRVDGQAKRGELQAVLCGVYRMPGTPVTEPQAAMAAALRCRPVAHISGPFVFGLLGVDGFSTADEFIVLVPPERRVRNVPFTVRRTALRHADTARVGRIPIAAVPRVAIDSAALLTTNRLLSGIDAAGWKGILRVDRLVRAAEHLPNHPGAAVIRQLYRAGALQLDSGGERRLAQTIGDLGLPIEWQVWIAPHIRVDGLIRAVALVLEYDSERYHDGEINRSRDRARDDEIRALGYAILHITPEDLRHPAALRARLVERVRQRERLLIAGPKAIVRVRPEGGRPRQARRR